MTSTLDYICTFKPVNHVLNVVISFNIWEVYMVMEDLENLLILSIGNVTR